MTAKPKDPNGAPATCSEFAREVFRRISRRPAATGIGLINSGGNLSGFVGSSLIGLLKSATGSYARGSVVIGMLEGPDGFCVPLLPRERCPEPRGFHFGESGDT